MKYGNPIRYDTLEAAGQEPDFEALAHDAYAAMNADGPKGLSHEEAAIERVNGMKEQYGTGVSALMMIYNATGSTMKFDSLETTHGKIYNYQPDPTIYNGEWSVFLHVKSSGAARGSGGAVKYWLKGGVEDKSHLVTVSWDVPWSGTTTAGISFFDTSLMRSFLGSPFQLMKKIGDMQAASPFDGRISFSQETSPIIRAVASRKSVL
ncbi:MAG: hypothetical protein WD969_13380 [Paracoccaceae bacterium]